MICDIRLPCPCGECSQERVSDAPLIWARTGGRAADVLIRRAIARAGPAPLLSPELLELGPIPRFQPPHRPHVLAPRGVLDG